jgi:hypothetical protein
MKTNFKRLNTSNNFDINQYFLTSNINIKLSLFRKAQSGEPQENNGFIHKPEGTTGGTITPDMSAPNAVNKTYVQIDSIVYDSKGNMKKLGANGPRRGSRPDFLDVGNTKGNVSMSRLSLKGNLAAPRYGWSSYRSQQ